MLLAAIIGCIMGLGFQSVGWYGPTWIYDPATQTYQNVLTEANGGLGANVGADPGFAPWAPRPTPG